VKKDSILNHKIFVPRGVNVKKNAAKNLERFTEIINKRRNSGDGKDTAESNRFESVYNFSKEQTYNET
jgi:hypothetical protein